MANEPHTDNHTKTITFQLGTHYLSRFALRAERLLRTIQSASTEKNAIIHHAALHDLFESHAKGIYLFIIEITPLR